MKNLSKNNISIFLKFQLHVLTKDQQLHVLGGNNIVISDAIILDSDNDDDNNTVGNTQP